MTAILLLKIPNSVLFLLISFIIRVYRYIVALFLYSLSLLKVFCNPQQNDVSIDIGPER